MSNYTTRTYTMKRSIIEFGKRIFGSRDRAEQKFSADMTYGMLASGSCLLTSIADSLHENAKKVNTVERLGNHLKNGVDESVQAKYLRVIRDWIPDEPVVLVDDSDVVKPEGKKFEALGVVRDGSESTEKKSVFKKGYHVTEAVTLTNRRQPVSIFSRIHSSMEKDYVSANSVTFDAIERGARLFGKATFVMDRGYDDNKMFNKPYALKQDFVLRLTAKRKVLYHGKWTPVTELRDRRKGKVKMSLNYHGSDHEAYLSHVRVEITASRRPIWLVLVYGVTEHPMMLATNKPILSKNDVIKVAKLYFSRWRIEEYFRCKKNVFDFENFRVRSISAINALNFYMTVCMAYLAFVSQKPRSSAVFQNVIEAAAPIKEKVSFLGYRIAAGVANILHYAQEGCKGWFKPLRRTCYQLTFLLD